MKTIPIQSDGTRVARVLMVLCLIASAGPIGAAKFDRARVTKAVNVVNLLPENRSPVKAKPGNVVSGATAVQTGMKSRAELEFTDESIVRLGSNSVFSFDSGGRELELKQGSMLIQVPKGLGTTRIKSLPVTAAITGTTILMEYSQRVVDAKSKEIKPGIIKMIVVEGSLEWGFNFNPGKKLKMRSGDMVTFRPNARTFPRKVKVNLARLKRTALLMDAGLGELPETARVDREISAQKRNNLASNQPARGILDMKPTTDNQARASIAAEPRSILKAIRKIIKPSKVRSTPPAPRPAPIVIPTRPERCPQDSLDRICTTPGGRSTSSR